MHNDLGRGQQARRGHSLGKAIILIVCYLVIMASAGLGWLYYSLPDTIYVERGQQVHIARLPYISALEDIGARNASATEKIGSYNTTLALNGILPLKTVRTVVTERPAVLVCGTPFGIKMFSDGALVVAFTDISTPYGEANPAKEAGIHLGDLIISVGGMETHSNDELAEAIHAASGSPVQVVFVREGEQRTVTLTPVQDESGNWKAGMWVRDSSAGVGTLTFVDESLGVFAGLGHSISDSDTGESITLRSGEIVACHIIGYTRGIAGSPGELKGQFSTGFSIGTVRMNGATGVYGTTRSKFPGQPMEVAFAQEITTGPAQIWTTIDGDQPSPYAVEIEKISYASGSENRNLVLRVTDPTLLQETGGIVQGMSGSPILQNGRLIGAVTHVLVNDPTRGYGIFAQTMLEQAESVASRKAA
jgi:stage IV sporulation protein B